jgi:polysaccharide export outer membrane protein
MRSVNKCLWMLVVAACAVGCRAAHPQMPAGALLPPADMPRELAKVVLPTYTVEPPDVLVIEALHVVPKSPYFLRSGDVVAVNVLGTLPDAPISGAYSIQPGGIVNLGTPYGTAKITGLSIEQAQEEIRRIVAMQVREPAVSASLVEMAGKQQIAGQHLVGPDGMVTLGTYGSVPIVGLTLAQAKQAIEQHLQQHLEDPEIFIDVFTYNSKVYYVILEGAGLGDRVHRFVVTGNDTVLDAIANIEGMTSVSSKKIWIARPVPFTDQTQILPVDWKGVTACGIAATNYQILPGDRVFVAEDHLVALDTRLAKLFAPWNRVQDFAVGTADTVTRFSGNVLQGGGLRGFFGGTSVVAP